MNLLDHINTYFGYEAASVKEFIAEYKEEIEGEEEDAVTELLMFLNSASKFI